MRHRHKYPKGCKHPKAKSVVWVVLDYQTHSHPYIAGVFYTEQSAIERAIQLAGNTYTLRQGNSFFLPDAEIGDEAHIKVEQFKVIE